MTILSNTECQNNIVKLPSIYFSCRKVRKESNMTEHTHMHARTHICITESLCYTPETNTTL